MFCKNLCKTLQFGIIFFTENMPMNERVKFGICLIVHFVWNFSRIDNKFKLKLNERTYIFLQSINHVFSSSSLCNRTIYTSTFK
jgi:hypothetical protein